MNANDYFNAGFDPIGLLPQSKDTREKGWNDPSRPRTATLHHEGGNLGLRTGVPGTAPNGALVDSDDDVPEAAVVSDILFRPTHAIFGRASKPRSHRMYVCTGDVPPHIKLNGLGGDDDTLCELRTRTKEGKALQTVVPPSVHVSGEAVVLDSPTFAPSPADSAFLVRATYLKGTAVLLARHLTVSRGHDYRMALAGFLMKLGFDAQEVLHTGLAIIALKGDGNDQDWRTVCRTSEQRRSSGHLEHDLTPFVDDARIAQHLRGWFGVKPQHQRTLTLRSLNTVQPQVTDWMWQDIVPVNHFGLHAGREGKGKSLSLLDIAAQLTRGTLPGKGTDDPGARMIASVAAAMDHDTRAAVQQGYAQVRLARERFLANHPELLVYSTDGITRVDGYTDPVKIARVEGPFGIQLHEDGFTIVHYVPLSEVVPPPMPEVVAVPAADQGYATEEECEAANPTCIAIHEIDGRFFAELPDDED